MARPFQVTHSNQYLVYTSLKVTDWETVVAQERIVYMQTDRYSIVGKEGRSNNGKRGQKGLECQYNSNLSSIYSTEFKSN